MKKVAILQSNYIPWIGYFHLMSSVDEFVVYDEAQYSKGDWRNRNQVKTANGPLWLTIPVQTKGKLGQKISETLLSDVNWGKTHWKTLSLAYAKSTGFGPMRNVFEPLYANTNWKGLSEVNVAFILAIKGLLNISTTITQSSNFKIDSEDPTGKLIEILERIGATEYVSGPAAKAYMKEGLFTKSGIKLSYVQYPKYSEYPQPFPPFVPNLSVLDLLFNLGPEAEAYLAAHEMELANSWAN